LQKGVGPRQNVHYSPSMMKGTHLTYAIRLAAIALVSGACLGVGLQAGDKKAGKAATPYPLDVCLVSGKEFGSDLGEPHVFVVDGQELKLCCKSCLGDFKENKPSLMIRVAKANQKVKPYPLKVCAVSGEKLGADMGDPYVLVYRNQEFKLCCLDCLEEFNKNKNAVLKKIVAASEIKK